MMEPPSRPPILPSRSELEGEEFFVSSRQDKRDEETKRMVIACINKKLL